MHKCINVMLLVDNLYTTITFVISRESCWHRKSRRCKEANAASSSELEESMEEGAALLSSWSGLANFVSEVSAVLTWIKGGELQVRCKVVWFYGRWNKRSTRELLWGPSHEPQARRGEKERAGRGGGRGLQAPMWFVSHLHYLRHQYLLSTCSSCSYKIKNLLEAAIVSITKIIFCEPPTKTTVLVFIICTLLETLIKKLQKVTIHSTVLHKYYRSQPSPSFVRTTSKDYYSDAPHYILPERQWKDIAYSGNSTFLRTA